MEIQHHLQRDKAAEEKLKQQIHLNTAAASPPSASSSPSHEFSFTFSLHPSAAKNQKDNKAISLPPFAAAIDLSPADEIFFHGHLLPLHLLSNLPVSPRSSTNSLESFTLPIKELLQENNSNSQTSSRRFTDEHNNIVEDHQSSLRESSVLEGKGRGKSKSFSLFGNSSKWRKGSEESKDLDDDQRQKKKSKFDLVKRYMRLVNPFLSFGNRKGNPPFLRQQPYSFSSGNIRVKSKKELRGRRGEFSAPVSMKTSPTDSGRLVASGTLTPTTNDSTMEELQAAIQAAIAHCKNSTSTEDKIKRDL